MRFQNAIDEFIEIFFNFTLMENYSVRAIFGYTVAVGVLVFVLCMGLPTSNYAGLSQFIFNAFYPQYKSILNVSKLMNYEYLCFALLDNVIIYALASTVIVRIYFLLTCKYKERLSELDFLFRLFLLFSRCYIFCMPLFLIFLPGMIINEISQVGNASVNIGEAAVLANSSPSPLWAVAALLIILYIGVVKPIWMLEKRYFSYKYEVLQWIKKKIKVIAIFLMILCGYLGSLIIHHISLNDVGQSKVINGYNFTNTMCQIEVDNPFQSMLSKQEFCNIFSECMLENNNVSSQCIEKKLSRLLTIRKSKVSSY